MSARQWPSGRGVVERSCVPVRSSVTDLALLRKPGCGVIRIVCTLKILQMATDTCRDGQIVVPVSMALRAQHADMCPRQGESRLRVIELGRLPRGRAMADFALLRQSSSGVIRIGRSLKVFQVTGNAGSRGQVVISVGVALRTLHLRVRTSQRKCCLGVIETGGLPGRSRMANFALLRHASCDVIRICSSLEVLNVTGDAGGRRQVVIAVGVALVALKLRMSTRKRKANRIVIETRGLPRGRGVAILAGLG